jgi:hypothetical protein
MAEITERKRTYRLCMLQFLNFQFYSLKEMHDTWCCGSVSASICSAGSAFRSRNADPDLVKVIRPTNGEKSEEILCFEVLEVLFEG